ncbi:MAG: Maf family protein, partial [Proteobacteria bacterium]|nr:Maf family protein [Pseudomonadota bacterium]
MLLERLLIDFTCESPDIDESHKENEKIHDLVLRLAMEKTMQVARNHSTGLIIGSDQAAECENQILGKPEHYEDAKTKKKKMSGKSVDFYTGLYVYNIDTKLSEQD